MRYLLLLSLFLFVPVTFSQQRWERTYGRVSCDAGFSAQQTSDGGYIVAGWTYSVPPFIAYAVYLVKTDSFGDTIWTRCLGNQFVNMGFSVQQTADGGYIVAGYTGPGYVGPYDFYLVKTDSFGDTIWTRTYGGTEDDMGSSVQQTFDGGFIIAGGTSSFGAGGYDFYLVKTDSFGDTIWTRTYGGEEADVGYSVQQTTDGGYIIAGGTRSFGAGGVDVYLVKTDSFGDTIWTRTYGGEEDDDARSVQQTTDGGYIVAGWTYSFSTGDSADVYLIKTDANGDTIWTRTYGGEKNVCGYGVQQTADGGYIIAGWTGIFSTGDSADVYLIKTDANGDTIWTRTYGSASIHDLGFSVQQTADGGYIIAGRTYTAGAGDVYLIKTDSLGLVSTGVEEQRTKPLPNLLLDVSPNPFTKTATIRYQLPSATPVRILAFDITGRTVATLFDQNQPAGTHQLIWQPKGLAQGIYFIKLQLPGFITTERCLYLNQE
ncbi:MAG: T9SS type A sorting domain-containing protein [candidate division WOR-3 bacterium]